MNDNLTSIHKQFTTHILHNQYLVPKSSILLSISGGQDSVTLLKLIFDFTLYYQWTIGLVHFDHKFRIDSFLNLQQVLNICQLTQFRSYIYENTVKNDSEVAWREWRYKIIFHMATINHYSKIITAHTKTDISETFLQYLLRGCGVDSISSIALISRMTHNIILLRPLLKFRRFDTAWLSRKFCLSLWSDSTNYEYEKTRNRLREELIPYLEQYFQPKLCYTIHNLLENAKIDTEYLQKATMRLYLKIKHPKFIAINYILLIYQPIALQHRIIKLFFKHNFNKTLTKQNINNIIYALKSLNFHKNYVKIIQFKLCLTNSWLYIIKLV